VHLDTGREMRGGQRQLMLLARKLRERGHQQLIVCPEGCALAARLPGEGFEIFALQPGRGVVASLLGLRRRLVRGRFQVVHAHDGRGQTLSAFASLGLGVRRVATRRVTFMPQGVGRILAIHRLQYGPTCDAIIAVSGFVRDLLVRSGIRTSKIEVIPDGVEIPAALPDAAERSRARQEMGLSPKAFVIGHAGAFTREKGQDILLEAFVQLLRATPEARLMLVGEGPLRQSGEVTELVRLAGGRAQIIEPIEDLTPFFAALDLYAMPSRAEGLGSSALLAMAHGLPVIASRVGGLVEVVAEGETGWLVPPESPAALADALVAAASNRDLLKQFGAAARERVQEFSGDTMSSRTEALYRRLVSHGG
jgi:glycosyltransferase involved in cell wall biosynthesis